MLKNIPKIVSPTLLKILCEMGHGDEIVIADGNFPAENYGKRVIRADGLGGEEMLGAVLSLIPLDTYADENLLLMQTTNGDPTPKFGKSISPSRTRTTTIFARATWNALLFTNAQSKRTR